MGKKETGTFFKATIGTWDIEIKAIKIRVLFSLEKQIKKGEFFFKTENGTLDYAYIEWTETMLLYILYKNRCQMPHEEQSNI